MSADPRQPWDDASVAEYALGVMPLAERQRFAADLERDALLRQRLAAWDERFAPLADDLPPMLPPADLYARIEARLDGGAPLATKNRWNSLWQGWRGFGLAGAAALAVLAAIIIVPRFTVTPLPLIAILSTPDAALALDVRFDAAGQQLTVSRISGAPQPERDHELWLIAGTDAPVSLGVLPDAGTVTIALPRGLAGILPGATLAISDEPDGGSSTGAPTGAVLAAATVTGV
ncbi:MAG: hypothetical protein HC779_08280 [Phyllobacteriaceae bacterium]|nr:hypothetical protein [Phyllobacteriaceae bacterium]